MTRASSGLGHGYLRRAIDQLEFSPAFDKFTPDAELIFGTEISVGAEQIKKFFIKIDSLLDSKHEIFEVWSGSGRIYVNSSLELIKPGECRHDTGCSE